jgi:hypothetical protein
MFMTAYRHLSGDISLYNGLIYPNMSGEPISKVIDRLKQLKGKQSNYMVNKLLKSVPAGTDGQMIDTVVFNNWAKLSNDEQIKIRDSYMELVNNTATREDATKLFNYLLVKDGGQFRNGSFIKFIANGQFKELYDAGAKVKEALSKKQYDGITWTELIGRPLSDLMNNFVSSYPLHIDNKQYLIRRPIPVIDTANYTPDQLKDMGWTVFGKEGSKQIELPQHYTVNNVIYQLDKVHKPDRGIQTANLVEPGQLIATGTRGEYKQVEPQGAPKTFRAGSAALGQLPNTLSLMGIKTIPQKVDNIPYAPSRETPKPTEQVQQPIQAPEGLPTPVTKQLMDKHNIVTGRTGTQFTAADNTTRKQIPVPENITTPEQLLDYLDTQEQPMDEFDEEDRIARLQQLARQQQSQAEVVPSQPTELFTKDELNSMYKEHKQVYGDKAMTPTDWRKEVEAATKMSGATRESIMNAIKCL